MNKKGFTLTELLGVIVLLGIVLGIASLGVKAINMKIRESYYDTLEESILLASHDYFDFENDKKPKKINDQTNVTLNELIEKKYLNEVLGKDKKTCDLNSSYVKALKVSSYKINYYVCLSCQSDNYKSKEEICEFIVKSY